MQENSEFEELMQEIEGKSSYKKKKSRERTMMSVKEMGDLLGLKKTARYWLLDKNYFESKVILGKTWVVIDSFEEWYANQIKYKKINGEEPGKKLKEWSYSIDELSELLEIEKSCVYDLLNRENIETVTVDYWKRVPKKVFYKWYENQTHYRTKADRLKDQEIEEATISMPEMARLLGISRESVYAILNNRKYLHFFEFVTVADKKRITKESFYDFLEGQSKYQLDPINDLPEIAEEPNLAIANHRRRVLARTVVKKGIGNQEYLTRKEAAILAKVAPNTISRWCTKNYFTTLYAGGYVRISRLEFENYLVKRNEKEEQNGIN